MFHLHLFYHPPAGKGDFTRLSRVECPAAAVLNSERKRIAVFPPCPDGIYLISLGLHSPFPLTGSRLAGELLHNSEVPGLAVFPFSSFRLIRKSCISHKHSSFVRFFPVIVYFIGQPLWVSIISSISPFRSILISCVLSFF